MFPDRHLERITHFCYDHARSEKANGRLLKIIYSERGGHSYGQTIAYQELLKNQAKGGTLVLTKRRVKRRYQAHHGPHHVFSHEFGINFYTSNTPSGMRICRDFLDGGFCQGIDSNGPSVE